MADTELQLATKVPTDFLEVPGAITVNFGALEGALSVCIWFLLAPAGPLTNPPEDRFRIVTAGLPFKVLLAMFSNLYKSRFPKKSEEELESTMKACSAAADLRNTMIHSIWHAGLRGDANEASRYKTTANLKTGLKIRVEHHAKEELIKVANELARLSDKVWSFMLTEVVADLPKRIRS